MRAGPFSRHSSFMWPSVRLVGSDLSICIICLFGWVEYIYMLWLHVRFIVDDWPARLVLWDRNQHLTLRPKAMAKAASYMRLQNL